MGGHGPRRSSRSARKLGMSLGQLQQCERRVLRRKFGKDSKNMSIVFGMGWPANYIA